MEIRFKLNPEIKRDKLIINWLLDIPKRERAVLVKEKLAAFINTTTRIEPPPVVSTLKDTSKIDEAINKLSSF